MIEIIKILEREKRTAEKNIKKAEQLTKNHPNPNNKDWEKLVKEINSNIIAQSTKAIEIIKAWDESSKTMN